VRLKSSDEKVDAVRPIFHAVNERLVSPLSWTHFRILLQVPDKEARNWYAREAIRETRAPCKEMYPHNTITVS
jgi:hypothetical protein